MKNSEESFKDSDAIIKLEQQIVGTTESNVTNTENNKEPVENSSIRGSVRKIAHAVEFTLLGLSVAGLLIVVKNNFNKLFLGWGYFYCLFVGVIDEFIQTFTGRTSMVRDVLIDFSGAFTGLTFCMIIFLLVKFIKNKKSKTL